MATRIVPNSIMLAATRIVESVIPNTYIISNANSAQIIQLASATTKKLTILLVILIICFIIVLYLVCGKRE